VKKYLYRGEMFWRKSGYPLAGVDEAGRGPLAGPVVAAAVILPENFSVKILSDLDDSKKLSPRKRLQLYYEIVKITDKVSWAVVSSRTIDRINILQATFLAMRRAISRLSPKPDFVLVDGNQNIPRIDVRQQAVVKGDAKVASVACAGIVAKVVRDELMKKYHRIFPEYDFFRHKGYGTKKHYRRIKKYGLSPIHRRSFCDVAPGR
jgi:ribonuclease HII